MIQLERAYDAESSSRRVWQVSEVPELVSSYGQRRE